MSKSKKSIPDSCTQELVAACRAEIPALTDRLISEIFTDNPEWTDYSTVARADLINGCRRYVTRILDLLGAPTTAFDDEVAASIGRRRAEQGVPLEAMLRTFRLGGRIVWEVLLDKADELAPGEIRAAGTALWAVIDGLSSSLVTSYRNTELEQLRSDERRRHALIEDLLAGRANDSTFAARAARELNLPGSSAYLVVVACGAGEAVHTGTETALAAVGIRSVWHDRVDSTVGLIAVERHDVASVLGRIEPHIRGRAGASPAVSGLAQVGTAHGWALLTLQTLPPDATGLVPLHQRFQQALLMRSTDLTDMLVTHTLGPVLALPAAERATLLDTLAAWLAHNCSAAHAAVGLHCHRNTVINRLHRISTLLGRPLEGRRDYVELSLSLAALDLARPSDGA
ncbi:helix-turn-helix domain-containing protein [Nocardia abscessus]|uniref:PucR family transcriptional regulator n=1 Tax=Nocardia abscessus TaxID=120957 RepID=UPI001893C94B|nr:helix-turn-helix domain-containing protein [Nocardia abscessus]MBF6339026.1 helix-turn-helix domain-containing protein [Nocardia abscessus]